MTLAGPKCLHAKIYPWSTPTSCMSSLFPCVDVFLWAPLFPFSYLQNVLNHSLPLARSTLTPGFESKRDNFSRSFTVQQIHLCVTWLGLNQWKGWGNFTWVKGHPGFTFLELSKRDVFWNIKIKNCYISTLKIDMSMQLEATPSHVHGTIPICLLPTPRQLIENFLLTSWNRHLLASSRKRYQWSLHVSQRVLPKLVPPPHTLQL